MSSGNGTWISHASTGHNVESNKNKNSCFDRDHDFYMEDR
jgi:hypothetical protein